MLVEGTYLNLPSSHRAGDRLCSAHDKQHAAVVRWALLFPAPESNRDRRQVPYATIREAGLRDGDARPVRWVRGTVVPVFRLACVGLATISLSSATLPHV